MPEIASCEFPDYDKLYDFVNKYNFNISVGDKVWVKVGTGGSKLVTIKKIETVDKLPSGYKQILEVVGMKYTQEPLKDGNIFVCDCRIWRYQWDADGGRSYQWSDLIVTCNYSSPDLKIDSEVTIDGTKGKVVNIRQISKVKAAKLPTVSYMPSNKNIYSQNKQIVIQVNHEVL